MEDDERDALEDILSDPRKFKLFTTAKSLQEIKQEAIRLADEEMQRNGIVAVGDISNDDSTIEVKWKSKIHYHTFIELIGFNPANAQKIYDAGVELRKKYTSKNLIYMSMII